MASVPYIKFFPTDWKGGTALLSDAEEFVYFKICLHCWDTGIGLREEQLHRLFRSPQPELPNIIKSLATLGKIARTDEGLWYNVRAVDNHAEAQDRRVMSRKAANKRWKYKTKTDDAAAMRGQSVRIKDAMPSRTRTRTRTRIKNIQSQPSISNNSNPSNPSPKSNGNGDVKKSVVGMNGNGHGPTRPSDDAIDRARELAPGYDVRYIENRYLDWAKDQDVRSPDKLFLKFVRTHVDKNPL